MAKKPLRPKDKLKTATPDDARAVWESIEKSGATPSARNVATALMASGQFHTVHFSKIARWKNNGWTTITRKTRQPAMVNAAAKLDAAATGITGDATKRLKDIIERSEIGEALAELPTEQLMDMAVRENAIASIFVALEVQRNPKIATEMPPLLVALSGSLSPTVVNFGKLIEIASKTIEGTAVEIIGADPLAEVWKEYDAKADGG